jgi:hypothetical protein
MTASRFHMPHKTHRTLFNELPGVNQLQGRSTEAAGGVLLLGGAGGERGIGREMKEENVVGSSWGADDEFIKAGAEQQNLTKVGVIEVNHGVTVKQ